MKKDRWTEVRRIFDAALELPPQDRTRYLAAACAGDADLLDRVLRLLEADAAGHSLLDRPAAPPLDLLDAEPAEAPETPETPPPERAGPYRLLEEVGRGGMGIVYRAERADGTFRRAVALKLVRGGFEDSGEGRARFRAEQRILGRLEHPKIARLYDAGIIADGRPYLVMEYVDGTRIDRYCDARRLDLRSRIRLFLDVCDAVEHAHRSLIIHRDLKPSNVLVRDDGSVKLLDFGIAKLTGDPSDDEAARTPETRPGLRLFTPEYASPEQIRGDPLTTGTDVYSLGALLYELLTGRRPFTDRVTATAYALGTDERTTPELPSRAITGVPSAAEDSDPDTVQKELAARRGTTTEQWRRSLRGDLDRIVLRTLARSPGDRYPSARGLADDLRRYLDGKPVSAAPPSRGYRLKKFVLRHRGGLAAAAGMVVALGVGSGFALRERQVATAEREVALGVSAFLEELFSASDPRTPRVQDTTRMIDFLDATGNQVRTELVNQPRTRARMLLILGLTYRNMGRNERAEPLLREAIAANRAVYGARHEDLAEAQRLLALLLSEQDRFEEAAARLDSALVIQRSLTGEQSWQVARLHEGMGQVLLSEGRLDQAVPHIESSLQIRRSILDPDDPVIASSLNTLGALKSRQGDEPAAIQLYEEAIAASLRSPGTVLEDVGVQRMNLASVYLRTGQYGPALHQAREGHAILADNIRPGVVARSRGRLAEAAARVWRDSGDEFLAAEADSLFRSGVALMRSLPEGRDARFLLHAYSRFLQWRGSLPEAEAAMREALALATEAMGDDHVEAHRLRADLAGLLVDGGRPADAEPLARRSHRALAAMLPPGHPAVVVAGLSLGRTLHALGRVDEGARLLSETRDHARAALGDEHPLTRSLHDALVTPGS